MCARARRQRQRRRSEKRNKYNTEKEQIQHTKPGGQRFGNWWVYTNAIVHNQDVEGEATANAPTRSPSRANTSSPSVASLSPVSLPRPRTPVDNPGDIALKIQEALECTAALRHAPATVVITVRGGDRGGREQGENDLWAVESRESVTVTHAVESRESVVPGHRIDATPFGAGWGGGGGVGRVQRAGSTQNSEAGGGARAVAGAGVGVGVVAKGADKASIDKASLVPHPRDPPYEPSQLAHSGPRVVGLNGELSTRGQGHPDAAALADVDTGQCCSVSLSHTRGGGRESVGEKRVVLNVNSCLRMHVLHVICV